MPPDRLRLLILIVAYNAESTLTPVLDRLPAAVLRDYDCEVLVIDDASDDGTFEHGLSYRQSHTDLPLTVLRNRSNQGYGGNQKVGYTYAIQEASISSRSFTVTVSTPLRSYRICWRPSSMGRRMRCSEAGCCFGAPLGEGACPCTSGSATRC